ncbi:MAG: hypothetical protein ACREBV_10680, partial [Candidatus Zixiibacteriota bacterium]
MSRLRDLEAIEVSLVPRAANKRKFLILKYEGVELDMSLADYLSAFERARYDELLYKAHLSPEEEAEAKIIIKKAKDKRDEEYGYKQGQDDDYEYPT